MNIKQAAQKSGISERNIRYYEQAGLITPARNPENDYRQYTEENMRTLKLIRVLRSVDMPVEDIRDVLQGKTAVAHGFLGCRDGKLGKPRHFAGFAPVNTFGRVKIFDFCGQFHLKIRCIKSRDRPNGAAASLNSGPAFSHGIAGRIYRAKAGDNDPAFLFCVHCTPHIPIPPSTQRTWPVM